jgi:hypothetical protein
MMTYLGFAERPVVPQLVLIDRDGNIHYQTPRLGDAESMKEDVIAKRIDELLEMRNHSKSRAPQNLLVNGPSAGQIFACQLHIPQPSQHRQRYALGPEKLARDLLYFVASDDFDAIQHFVQR